MLMSVGKNFLIIAVLLLSTSLAHAQESALSEQEGFYYPASRTIGSVYVMDNDPSGNNIVVYNRLNNGALRKRRSVRTGGLGAGDNAAADPLGSQESLILSEDRRFLYAVNAGSNTISVFNVRRRGIPILIQRINSRGLFPVSLTVKDDLVYVLNAGGDGAIAGFRRERGGYLEYIPESKRNLNLNGEDFPAGDLRNLAPGDISFDTVGRRILVTFLGGQSLLSFGVQDNDTPTGTAIETPSVGASPFALDFSDNGTAIIAEASGSLSSYNFDEGANLVNISTAVANNQEATCWVRINGNAAFTANTNSGTISSYQISRNGVLTLKDEAAASDIGAPIDFDITRNGRFLYVVAAEEGGVRAYRIKSSGQLVSLGLFKGLPTFDRDGFSAQGLAIR